MICGNLWTLFIKAQMTQKDLLEIMPAGFAKTAITNVDCIVIILLGQAMSHNLMSHCPHLFQDPVRRHQEFTVIRRIWYKTRHWGWKP